MCLPALHRSLQTKAAMGACGCMCVWRLWIMGRLAPVVACASGASNECGKYCVLRTGKEYEARLRQQHSKLHPRTSWAAAEGRKRRRQRGRDAAEPDDDEDEEG